MNFPGHLMPVYRANFFRVSFSHFPTYPRANVHSFLSRAPIPLPRTHLTFVPFLTFYSIHVFYIVYSNFCI